MGAGASVKRSPNSLMTEIERLWERELNTKEEGIVELEQKEALKDAKIAQLQGERDMLALKVSNMERELHYQEEGWKKEKDKTMSLTYSNLPMSLIGKVEPKLPTAKIYPLATVAQCDVVGFSKLVAQLKPHQVIVIVDHLHALIGEAFHDKDIMLERNSERCIATSGLREDLQAKGSNLKEYYGSLSSLSLADSSYGSETNVLESGHEAYAIKPSQHIRPPKPTESASYYASIVATSALHLMSASSKVQVPLLGRKQLQLRIALHSGPCSAGVLGLHTCVGSNNIPQFKLMGPTIKYASVLCQTSLALQIRVSKECKALLDESEVFLFERCPDFVATASQKPMESYWLVGQKDLPLKMPSLDLAIPLNKYEDIEV